MSVAQGMGIENTIIQGAISPENGIIILQEQALSQFLDIHKIGFCSPTVGQGAVRGNRPFRIHARQNQQAVLFQLLSLLHVAPSVTMEVGRWTQDPILPFGLPTYSEIDVLEIKFVVVPKRIKTLAGTYLT